MGALGDIGSVLAYGLGTGANTRADELRKQSELLRQEGLSRLKHDFAIDEADYRNRQAVARDETQYNRELGIAKMRDKSSMDRLKWQYNHRSPQSSQFEKQFAAISKLLSPEDAKRWAMNKVYPQKGFDVNAVTKQIDAITKTGNPASFAQFREMIMADPDYIKANATNKDKAGGKWYIPFDGKEAVDIDPLEWGKEKYPQAWAAANQGEKLLQQLTGGQQAAPAGLLSMAMGQQQPKANKQAGTSKKKEIRSKEDLASVKKRIDGLKGMELERALQEAREVFDDKSYQLILESLGLGKKKTSIINARGPETNLGEIAGSLTNGIGKAGKWAYKNADKLGKQLTAAERKALKLNNSVGRYITDRFKEAYLPGK